MATDTMVKKEQSAPNVIMATSFLKRARGVKVLTTDNTIESYPACRMRELHNLADMFDWVIFPMRLCDFDKIIKAYSRESVYYAWELYQAYIRFINASNGHMRFYIIAPLSFLDTYSLMTEYSGFDDIIENAYFPQSLKKIQDSIEVLKPLLMETRAIINGMAKIIEDNRRRQQEEEDKKKDPCIFAIDAKDDICDPKAIARLGLCWGPELTDFVVGDLPRNNGAFQTVTYPWSKDMVKNVAYRDLDSDHQITNSYLVVMEAFNALCKEFEGACWSSESQKVRRQVAETWGIKGYINTLMEAFPEKRAEIEEIQEHIDMYFKINGDSESCPGRYKELYTSWKCGADTRNEIRKEWAWHKSYDRYRHRTIIYYDCITERCYIKAKCAHKIVTLLYNFSKDFLDQYYVKKIKKCFKEQEHGEMLELIPLIQAIEKDDGDSRWYRKSDQIKEAFPKFWAFYKLVTE